jgi:hypothetical protein
MATQVTQVTSVTSETTILRFPDAMSLPPVALLRTMCVRCNGTGEQERWPRACGRWLNRHTRLRVRAARCGSCAGTGMWYVVQAGW